MTAETFLEQYGEITAMIERKKKLKEKAEAQAEDMTSHLTPDKVQSSGNLQKMAEAIAEALDLDKEIKELFIQKNEVRKLIEGVINQVKGKPGEVLYEKYLLLNEEDVIAKVIDRTEDTVYRLLKEGKEKAQKILDEECGEMPQNN
jgi:DNA-directed RNA polymerase specialized sigma24 family protein